MSEQCNANEVDKQLSKLSFRDKGIGVGFGSIKHWLIMDNLALHNQLFTSVEILEMTTSGGGQHLDSAEGVSSCSWTVCKGNNTKDVSFYHIHKHNLEVSGR